MTTRQYHCEGLQHAESVLKRLASGSDTRPSDVEIENATKSVKAARAFLRDEQAAISLLIDGIDQD